MNLCTNCGQHTALPDTGLCQRCEMAQHSFSLAFLYAPPRLHREYALPVVAVLSARDTQELPALDVEALNKMDGDQPH